MQHSILIPRGDITLEQLQTVVAEYDCTAKLESKGYYEISSGDPLNFFWLGMNFNHKMGFDDLASELKKSKPHIYK